MEKTVFLIPVYIDNQNGVRFLEKTIQGMKQQSDPVWEAILINDCSPLEQVDLVIEKAQKGDNRIHSITLSERVTTGQCRNVGVEWAYQNKFSIILYNDADDISHPDRVKITKERMKADDNIAVLYSGFKVINEYNEVVSEDLLSPAIIEILKSVEQHPTGVDCWYKIGTQYGYTNITSATSVRVDIAKRELFPDEFVSEDMHTWLRYFTYGKLEYAEEIPTLYRIPSYEKRQSSNKYVQDFNANKVRVDIDGFKKALRLRKDTLRLTEMECKLIELHFLSRLTESMCKVNRYDLVDTLLNYSINTLSEYHIIE